MENWKDIPGYEGKYQVSDLGNVRSLNYRQTGKCQLIKPSIDKKYLQISLRLNMEKKTFRVHQLVAMAFLGHKSDGNKTEVDHIDHNKHNNRLDNLRIVTARENNHHSLTKRDLPIGVRIIRNRYQARININGTQKALGNFSTPEEASAAYQAALKHYQES